MAKLTFIPNSAQQRDFLLSRARYAAFIGGTGSGKTAAGAVKAVTKIARGQDGAIVAPDFPQLAKSTWPEFAKWCPWSYCTNAHLDHPYTQKKVLTFEVNRKVVTVYYGGIEDESSWAGLNINWAWGDELARKRTRRAFDVLAARIRIGPQPQLWITTTPAGINHWLYDVFVKGIFDDRTLKILRESGYEGPIVERFHGSTDDNRENLDDLHYLMLKGMYSGRYAQQELHGEFITMEGAVWEDFITDPDDPNSNVTEDAEYIPGLPVEWWVDDGYTRGHPRVILFAQEVPPFVNVFDEYVAEYEVAEVSIVNALQQLTTHAPDITPSVAYVDSSAAEFRRRLWDAGIDTVAASHNVEEGIKHTASWIRDGDGVAHVRFHPRCEFAIQEIKAYVIDENTKRPRKESDNAADAMRYGLHLKDLGEFKQTEEQPTPQKQKQTQIPEWAQRDPMLTDYLQRWYS